MSPEAGVPATDGHMHHQQAEPRLRIALAITLGALLVEVAGGLATGSLALLSDAGHMLADAGALALAVIAQRMASRPRSQSRTYGWRRAETLAAFLNGIVLGVTAVGIVVEAFERWAAPPVVHGGWMLAVAAFGLIANLGAARTLSQGPHNANTRAALAHVLSDVGGSLTAMLAAVLILAFGWRRADAVASVFLAALILWSAWALVQRTAAVLMESTPPGLSLADLEATIRATPGVADLHDLHAWTISDGFDLVTVHVVLDGGRHGTDVAREVARRVHDAHRIEHVTVQPEAPPAATRLQIRRASRA